ncbi:MAG: hypothetical protein WC901_02195 [Candidatus Margulisiibacteriota bacterium]
MRQSGFSLLEIILAVGLLVMAVCGLVQGIIAAGRFMDVLDRRGEKISESIKIMEQIKSVSFEALGGLDGSTFWDGRGKIKIVPVSATLQKIMIWVGEESKPEVYFETLSAN